MKKLPDRLVIGIGLVLLSPAAFAMKLEEAQALVGQAGLYVLVLIMIVAAVFVYFMPLPSRDKRAAPLHAVLNGSDQTREWSAWFRRAAPLHAIMNGSGLIYSVGPDALVMECVGKMTDKKIGGLIVMNGEKLIGIFTERDALSRVLAAGRDPRTTTVSEVMTKNPYCVSPEMSVADAMELVAKRRFRHLPIVENGEVLAVLSNRDLTRWLVKDRVRDVKELVQLAIPS